MSGAAALLAVRSTDSVATGEFPDPADLSKSEMPCSNSLRAQANNPHRGV
jgi:hypothetical protein